ncbi:MAG: hypothetical protein AAF235_06370 [Planctomycetota bacterium]
MTRIGAAFGDDDLLSPVATCPNIAGLVEALSAQHPGLVLVDIDPDPMDALAELQDIVDRHPLCRFVILAPEFDRNLIVLAMQSGARHFMPKPWIDEGMAPVCRELCEQIELRLAEVAAPRDDVAEGSGPVLSVLSAGGGSGATTLAVALADACAEIRVRESDGAPVLIDLDERFGSAATHLNAAGDYGIADLLAREGPLDAELVHSAAVDHDGRFGLLLSPAAVAYDAASMIPIERLGEVIDAMRSTDAATVIDAPWLPPQSAAALADVSCLTLVSMSLSVRDVRAARMLLGVIKAESPGARVGIAVRVSRRRGAVSLKDAIEALEHDGPVFEVPDDPVADEAWTKGVTLREISRKSKLVRAIDQIARSVIVTEAPIVKPKRERGKKAA